MDLSSFLIVRKEMAQLAEIDDCQCPSIALTIGVRGVSPIGEAGKPQPFFADFRKTQDFIHGLAIFS